MRVGIVYATESKMVRRIIVPDDGSRYDYGRHTGDGESLITADLETSDVASAQAAVAAATGVTPADYTCAVIDAKGAVVCLLKADPALDDHPLGDLIVVSDGLPAP